MAQTAVTVATEFPHGAARFLGTLRRNNRKDWFDKHRNEYEEVVLEPAKEFVIDLGTKLRKLRPHLRVDQPHLVVVRVADGRHAGALGGPGRVQLAVEAEPLARVRDLQACAVSLADERFLLGLP